MTKPFTISSTRNLGSLRAALIVCLLAASAAGQSPLSDFEDGTLQGWEKLTPWCGTLTVSGVGNPSLAMLAIDTAGACGTAWVKAPPEFSGDLSVHAGLMWDEYVFDHGANTMHHTFMWIVGSNGSIYESILPTGPLETWTTVDRPFTEEFWLASSGSDSLASVLCDVQHIQLLMETSTTVSTESQVDNLQLYGTGFRHTCNGDGGDQMGCTACPCANESTLGTVGGCLNSAATPATLAATGDASVSLAPDSLTDLRFSATGATPSAFCILNSGDAAAPTNPANVCFGSNSGLQSLVFDGLRCAVLNTRRHGGRSADANGVVGETTPAWGGEGDPPSGIAGAGFSAGQTRYFQVIYRDNPSASCQRGLNTSQAIEVTFAP